jgi:hypothetical protein
MFNLLSYVENVGGPQDSAVIVNASRFFGSRIADRMTGQEQKRKP